MTVREFIVLVTVTVVQCLTTTVGELIDVVNCYVSTTCLHKLLNLFIVVVVMDGSTTCNYDCLIIYCRSSSAR